MSSICKSSGKGCQDKVGYLCYVMSVSDEKKKMLEEILIVSEYVDVFPEDLRGLPSKRVVDFHIDLVPGVTPISKVLYRMAHAEMLELRK